MSHEAAETTHNINNAFGPGLLTNVQCSGGSRSFAKERRALKMRSTVAGHQKLTTTNWEQDQSWSSYNYRRSCQRTQRQPFYGHLAFEANWKGKKSQQMNVSQADQKRKKKSCFDVSSPFLHDNNEPFIDHAMKSGHLITGDDQLSGWIEKKHQSTSQSETCNNKGVLVTFGGLLVAWSTISFWIPEKPLPLRSILSKMNAQMHVT